MNNPTLYIIMRSDIADMNPGKGMAQSAHAQAEFSHYMQKAHAQDVRTAYEQWCEDRSFGRTLVLSGTKATIEQIVGSMKHSGIVVDTTYPWRNYYKEVFVSKETTCGWVFVSDPSEASEEMRSLGLHQ